MAAPLLPRSGHVKRVFKIVVDPETKEEVLSTDLFIDVRRMDDFTANFQSTDQGGQSQAITYALKWKDDPRQLITLEDAKQADIQHENANAVRKTETRRISDPDVSTDSGNLPAGASTSASSINDNDILLWIVHMLKVFLWGTVPMNQGKQIVFRNQPPDGSQGKPAKGRKTTPLKIVHNDLNGLKMVDDAGRPIPIDWVSYANALRAGNVDPDDGLFLIAEAADKFVVDFGVDANNASTGQGIANVNTEYRLDVEQMFLKVDPKAKEYKDHTVIRLDPFQVIVNVGSNIIAVEFEPEGQ